MKQVTVTIHVSPAAAVRAGKAQCGDIALALSEADIAALTDDQREGLALHLAAYDPSRGSGGAHEWCARLNVGADPDSADIATLAKLLDMRRANVLAHAEAKRADKTKEDEAFAACEAACLEMARTFEIERLLINDSGLVSFNALRWNYSGPYVPSSRELTGTAVARAGREAEAEAYLANKAAEKRAAEAAKAARAAEVRAAMAKLILVHFPVLLPVWEAGKARKIDVEIVVTGEVTRRVAPLVAGIEPVSDGPYSSKECETMRPVIFAHLETLRARLPGAEVTGPYSRETPAEYRKAEDDDDPDDIDEDGDVCVRKRSFDNTDQIARVKLPNVIPELDTNTDYTFAVKLP